jgi:hypothetical protein
LEGNWIRISGFVGIVLKNVAERPIMETGAGVPGYSGGLAAAWLFRIRRLRNIGARATSGEAGVRIRIKAFVSGA